MLIDINTAFIVILMIGFVIALILMIVGLGVDDSLLYWAGGYGINSVSFLLISLRGSIPDLLSIWLANVMMGASYALFTHGLLKFLNRELNPLLIWAPVFVIAALFPFLISHVEARIVLAGLSTGAQSLLLAYVVISSNSQLIGRGKHILAAAFMFGVLICLARPLTILLGLDDISAFDSPAPAQVLTYLSVAAIHVALALGLVLMQKEHAEAATDSIARSDELTGLPNRRRLYERINQVMSQKGDQREFGALLLIDLDNFKVLNDEHGHAVGDELLRLVAQRLLACTASTDTTARLGGDEFVVLLTALGNDRRSAMQSAMMKAEEIRRTLTEPYILSGVMTLNEKAAEVIHCCSGSVGVALLGPDQTDREALLREADRAMYSAKNMARQ